MTVWQAFIIDLQSLLRRFGTAEDKKTGFVKPARAPIDCVQLQLDECIQIAYLYPRLLIQSLALNTRNLCTVEKWL